MRFVATHTKIPVPGVLFTFRWYDDRYIAMSRVPGKNLKWKKLSSVEQNNVLCQLAAYFSQLCSIPASPKSVIGSVLGGPFYDPRVYFVDISGPYRDEEHFYRQLRRLDPIEAVPEIVRAVHRESHPFVFTHNDVAPRNIMVDGDRVTGIIDWERAAWLPDFWEYCKAVNWIYGFDMEFKGRVSSFLMPYEREAEADHILTSTYGDIYEMAP
jgi:aminoglycoside phosphotransferase (APT) family kinase protein